MVRRAVGAATLGGDDGDGRRGHRWCPGRSEDAWALDGGEHVASHLHSSPVFAPPVATSAEVGDVDGDGLGDVAVALDGYGESPATGVWVTFRTSATWATWAATPGATSWWRGVRAAATAKQIFAAGVAAPAPGDTLDIRQAAATGRGFELAALGTGLENALGIGDQNGDGARRVLGAVPRSALRPGAGYRFRLLLETTAASPRPARWRPSRHRRARRTSPV
jgi:hypothetical protein